MYIHVLYALLIWVLSYATDHDMSIMLAVMLKALFLHMQGRNAILGTDKVTSAMADLKILRGGFRFLSWRPKRPQYFAIKHLDSRYFKPKVDELLSVQSSKIHNSRW